MARALKTAALVVGAVALVATGVGAVAAAGTALAITAGTVATIATVASSAISAAVLLTAKKPSAQATGSQTNFSADPDAGIPWILGRTGTAGNIVYRRGFDTKDSGDNDRQSFVAVLSLGPVAAVEAFTVDRASVTFNGSGQAVGAYSGFMWQTIQLGALSGPALGFGTGAGAPPGWSASHRLSGKAAATWTLRFDTKAKLFQNGVPAPMWVVRGAFCYDPRKDSSYPGGSGSHRMADPADTAAYDAAVATWEWTENPYLLGLRFVHGIWQRDVANSASKWQRVVGMGAPQSGIDLAAFVEGANVAQANSWAAGGVIFSGDDKWQSLKKILQAGMGEPLALGAKIGCLVNAPKVSLATIGIDDVVGDASVGATQPRRSRVNTITPRYRLEANNWQLLPGSPITVADYVTIDRGRRSRVQDYPFIQNSSQVGTAVRYDIENAREFGPIVLPLKLFWMGYKPGDCVTATLPELGLNAQPILLLNRSLDPSAGVVTMTARSETPGKHPFALGQTATPPPTPGVTGAPIVPTPGETAWTISGTKMTSGLVAVPALIVTGAVDAGSPDAVVFEYRPFSSGQAADVGWIAAGIEPPTTTRKEIVSVTGGTPYEVAVSYRARGVQSARRILGPVTTDDFSGSGGAPGLNNATVTIYQRSASGAPTLPSAVATYTFATTTLSGLNNGWSTSIPAGTDPIYASAATASSTGATDTIAANEWAAARQIASNGANGTSGLNNKSLFIYQRAASAPGLPSANATYTFSTAALSGLTNGWTATIPAGANPLYVSTATALSATDTDSITPGEWAAVQILAQNGKDGRDGLNGNDGAPGAPGANGQTSYLHTAYADSADGSVNFTTGAPGTRKYLGVLVDFAPADSTTPSAYAWSLIKGADGLNGSDGTPGAPGANGQPTYVHIAYANSANGTVDFSTDNPANRTYVGFYVDQTVADSTNPALYTWSLVKGSDGANGISPVQISLVGSMQSIKYNKLDQISSGNLVLSVTRQNISGAPFFRLVGLNGNQYGGGDKTAAQLASDYPGIFSSTGPDNVTITQDWLAAVVADGGGGLRITVFPAGGAIASTLTLAKVKDGADGAPGPQGPPGTTGEAATPFTGTPGRIVPPGTTVTIEASVTLVNNGASGAFTVQIYAQAQGGGSTVVATTSASIAAGGDREFSLSGPWTNNTGKNAYLQASTAAFRNSDSSTVTGPGYTRIY